MHTCTHAYTHTHIHTHIHAHIHTCIDASYIASSCYGSMHPHTAALANKKDDTNYDAWFDACCMPSEATNPKR